MKHRVGITLSPKIEKMCPNFDRLHILLGERVNVNPPQLGVVGLLCHLEIYHHVRDASLDDDNEDDLDDYEEGAVEDDIEQVNNEADDVSYCLSLTQFVSNSIHISQLSSHYLHFGMLPPVYPKFTKLYFWFYKERSS